MFRSSRAAPSLEGEICEDGGTEGDDASAIRAYPVFMSWEDVHPAIQRAIECLQFRREQILLTSAVSVHLQLSSVAYTETVRLGVSDAQHLFV